MSVKPSLPLSVNCFLFMAHLPPSGPGPPLYQGFTIKPRHTTLSRASISEWSTSRRAFYLTTLATHKRQKSMPLVGFEPTDPASDQSQTHALQIAVTGIDSLFCTDLKFFICRWPWCALRWWMNLTHILLTWKIWWALNNASRWQMGFNSAFKGLK